MHPTLKQRIRKNLLELSIPTYEGAQPTKSPSIGAFDPKYIAEYFGLVNYTTNDRVIQKIKNCITTAKGREVYLLVTSAGGPSGTAMSFYDTVRSILRPSLTTIAAGDVDSSGVIIFLSGNRRYVTKHTTSLLHLAGRTFEADKRFTATEIEAMAREDRLKDLHYASIVAEHTGGLLTVEEVLQMMSKNTVLSAEELVSVGIAHGILE